MKVLVEAETLKEEATQWFATDLSSLEDNQV